MRGFMKNNIKHDRKTKRNSNLSREMTYSQDSEANDKLELCITNSIMVENILRFEKKHVHFTICWYSFRFDFISFIQS